MKIFQKTWVAVTLTIAMIVGALFIGYQKAEPDTAPKDVGLDTSLSYSQFDNFILDEPGLLTDGQRKEISIYNANWNQRYNSIIAVAVVNAVEGDIVDYSYQLGAEAELGKADAILVMDSRDGNSYLAVAEDYPMNNEQVTAHMDQYLYDYAMEGQFGKGILNLFAGINTFYVNNYGLGYLDDELAVNSGSMLVNIAIVLAIVLVIATIVDNLRYNSYRRRYYGVAHPPYAYRPLLFWHGPGYNWYWRRWRTPAPPRHDHHNPPGGGFTGFHGPSSGSSSGPRGGGFSGGSRGGGFSSGGSRGGGFSR